MDVRSILAEIDAEIATLQNVRATLTGLSGSLPSVGEGPASGRRGRPKGSKNTTKAEAKPKTTRNLSPEARKRIADAQKRRWADKRSEPAASGDK